MAPNQLQIAFHGELTAAQRRFEPSAGPPRRFRGNRMHSSLISAAWHSAAAARVS